MMVSRKKLLPEFNVYYAAFVANLCATAATCIMCWSSPTLPLITNPGSRILVTLDEAAWISSIPALGAALGPFITGCIVDYFGRKRTLLAIMLLFVVSWMVIYFSSNIAVLLCSRFAGGLGVGCIYATLPMFVAEISPVNLRGPLCSLIQLFDCFAYLIENIVGGLVSYDGLIIVSAILPLICFLLFLWIPESPYHLHNKGYETEALKSLQYFRGHDDLPRLHSDIVELQASAENIQNNSSSVLGLFRSKGCLKSVYYSLILVVIQQGSGINIITFYSEHIFQESGSIISSNASAVILAAVMTFSAVLVSTATRIFTRRSLLTFSSVGITVSMVVIGFYFHFKDETNVNIDSVRWIPITGLMCFMFTYSLGHGPLVWVITSEIFPSHLKAAGCALAAAFMWLLAFLLTRYFLPLTKSYGKAIAFWGFGAVGAVSLLFIIFQLPETKGKTFQEIQLMIHGAENKSDNIITNKKSPIREVDC